QRLRPGSDCTRSKELDLVHGIGFHGGCALESLKGANPATCFPPPPAKAPASGFSGYREAWRCDISTNASPGRLRSSEPVGSFPCRKGLLDFLEDVLQLLQLGLQLVDPHADVGEPQVGVLLGGDRHVAETTVLVGETLEVLVRGDRRLRLPRGTEVP